MRTLFLDLLSQNGLLACLDGDKVVSSKVLAGRTGDHELPPLLLETVKDAEWQMTQVQRIACVTGPGGFTSQRVAVALANALSWGLRIPAAGVHLRDLWTARSSSDAAWAHSTKKDLLFFALPGEEIRTLAPAEAAAAVPAGVPLTGELLPEHEEVFGKSGVTHASTGSVTDVLPAFLASLAYARIPLEPWYGRGW